MHTNSTLYYSPCKQSRQSYSSTIYKLNPVSYLNDVDMHMGSINKYNTPGTAGGPGGRDRTLAVKSRKTAGSFPEVGKKQKTEERERKILQGLWVAQAAVTERWPLKAEKTAEKSSSSSSISVFLGGLYMNFSFFS